MTSLGPNELIHLASWDLVIIGLDNDSLPSQQQTVTRSIAGFVINKIHWTQQC